MKSLVYQKCLKSAGKGKRKDFPICPCFCILEEKNIEFRFRLTAESEAEMQRMEA